MDKQRVTRKLLAVLIAFAMIVNSGIWSMAKATPTDAKQPEKQTEEAKKNTEDPSEVTSEDVSTEETVTEDRATEEAQVENVLSETTQEAAAPTEQYILEHANPAYTGVQTTEPFDVLHVRHTMLDGAKLPRDLTIDAYWNTREKDGTLTYIRAFLVQHEADVLLYNLDDTSSYLVGLANTMTRDGGIMTTDSAFALCDNWGSALTDCIYEKETGLVYVPKAYLATAIRQNGMETGVFKTVQLQLLHLLVPTQAETTVKLCVEADVPEVETKEVQAGSPEAGEKAQEDTSAQERLVSFDAEAFTTTLLVSGDERTSAALSAGPIEVYVNDLLISQEDYEYNKMTGLLTVQEAPCNIDSIRIRCGSSEGEFEAETKALLADGVSGNPADWETFQTWTVDGEPKVGDFFNFGTTSIVYDLSSDGRYTRGDRFYYGYYSYGIIGDAVGGTLAGGRDCPLASYVMNNSANIIEQKLASNETWFRTKGETSAFGFYFGPDVPNVQKGISSVIFGPTSEGCTLSTNYNTNITQANHDRWAVLSCAHIHDTLVNRATVGNSQIATYTGRLYGRIAYVRFDAGSENSGYFLLACVSDMVGGSASARTGQAGTGILKVRFEIPETYKPYYVSVKKSSEDASITNDNKLYNPKGVCFDLYREENLTATATEAHVGKFLVTDDKWTVKATSYDADYPASGSKIRLTEGFYYIKETKGSEDGSILKKSTNEAHFEVTKAMLKEGGTKTLSFTDPPQTTEIRIKKKTALSSVTSTNRTYSLEGAKFGIYKTKEDAKEGKNRVGVIATDESGSGSKDGLAFGTYYVKEITAPTGYTVNDTIYTAKAETKTAVTVSVEEQPLYDTFDLLVIKKHAEKELRLPGAVYEVRYYDVISDKDPAESGESIKRKWRFITDEKGEIRYGEDHLDPAYQSSKLFTDENGKPVLPLGTITIKEVQAPTGYVKSDTVTVLKIDASYIKKSEAKKESAAVRTNTPKRQAFSLEKHGETGKNEENPLAGAGFSACPIESATGLPVLEKVPVGYEAQADDVIVEASDGTRYFWDEAKRVALAPDGMKELFTGENGTCTSAELDYGRYVVRETTVPENYLRIPEFTVDIRHDSRTAKQLGVFVDKSFRAYLRIIKKDAATGEEIRMNPAAFRLWSVEKNTYVEFEVKNGEETETVNVFETGDDGIFETPEPLYPGKYRIEEIKNPSGYYTEEPAKVYEVEIFSGRVYEAEKNDAEGQVAVAVVTVENTPVLGNIQIKKLAEKRAYDPKTKEYAVQMAEFPKVAFTLYAAEDIKNPGNSEEVLYKKGAVVKKGVTDEKGALTFDSLPLGSYVVREKKQPGYDKAEDVKVVLAEEDAKAWIKEEGMIEKTVVYRLTVENYRTKIEIGTRAQDKKTGTDTGEAADTVVITDRVTYKNLVKGRKYQLVAVPVYFGTTERLKDPDGNEITAQLTFTPEKSSGTVEVPVTITGIDLKNKSVTILEYLYEDGVIIAAHDDSSDKKQTVHYKRDDVTTESDHPKSPVVKGTSKVVEHDTAVKTGDHTKPMLFFALLLLSAMGAASLLYLRKRKKSENNYPKNQC